MPIPHKSKRMDFFKNRRHSSLLIALQQAHEEAYQSVMNAILLETRNEHYEALQAWKATLRKISLGLAAVTDTPQSGQEVDLMTNIMNIEKQCHERIDFLERTWSNHDSNPYSSYMTDSDEYIDSQIANSNSDDSSHYNSSNQYNGSNQYSHSNQYNQYGNSNHYNPNSYSNSNSNSNHEYDTSDYGGLLDTGYYGNWSQTVKTTPPPVPPKVSLNRSNPPLPPVHYSDYQSRLDPYNNVNNTNGSSAINGLNDYNSRFGGIGSSSNTNNTSGNTNFPAPVLTHTVARVSPKRRPTPSSDAISKDVNAMLLKQPEELSTKNPFLNFSSNSKPDTNLVNNYTNNNINTNANANPNSEYRSSFKESKHASSTPTLSPALAKTPQSPPKAASTSSLSNNNNNINDSKQLSELSTPSSLSVDQQFAALKLLTGSSPNLSNDPKDSKKAQQSLQQQQQPAPRAMLKTLRSTSRVPKAAEERKVSSNVAAHMAWTPPLTHPGASVSPRSSRSPAPRASSPNVSNLHPSSSVSTVSSTGSSALSTASSSNLAPATSATNNQTSSSHSQTSSSTPTKHIYNKPKIFKAPIIHAPVINSVKKTVTPGAAASLASAQSRQAHASSVARPAASAQAPRKVNKYIVVEKRTSSSTSGSSSSTNSSTAKRLKPPVAKINSTSKVPSSASKTVKSSNTASKTAKSSSLSVPSSAKAGPKTTKTVSSTSRTSTPELPDKQDTTGSSANGSDISEGSDAELDEEEAWLKKARATVAKIKGIDQNAAESILNDVVVKGDPVSWDDIAGLEQAKGSLKEAVVYPFLRPDLFSGLREPAQGVLLFGPPGTGKTMLARAVATESKSTFFSISASSLTSKFLGESEKLVRALFLMAKALAPSIIFVDEIDSLLSARSDSGEHESSRRIKTEFLIQWSALQHAAAGKEHEDVTRVLVLAATNLPWVIDEAARRRFVRRQYIPLPEPQTREHHLLKLLSRQKHSLTTEQIAELVALTDGFSGSDLTALAKDAAMGPLRALGEALLTTPTDQIRPLGFDDFVASLKTIRPSVSKDSLKVFEDWAGMYGSSGA